MKRNLLLSSAFFLFTSRVVLAQSGPSPMAAPTNGQGSSPVSYASVTQLNGMLTQLEDTSKKTQGDLQKLRIEKWKTDGSYKKQALGNVEARCRRSSGNCVPRRRVCRPHSNSTAISTLFMTCSVV